MPKTTRKRTSSRKARFASDGRIMVASIDDRFISSARRPSGHRARRELRLRWAKRGIHRSTSLSSAPGCALVVLASKLGIKRVQRRQVRRRFELPYLHCCNPLLEIRSYWANRGWLNCRHRGGTDEHADFYCDRDI